MKLLSCFKLTHEFKKQLSSRFLHVVLERLGNTKASRLCDKMHFIIFGGSFLPKASFMIQILYVEITRTRNGGGPT